MRSTPADGGRVLIVEDEPALARALQINLRARGYEVVSSGSGHAALAEAARRPPAAVLLDLGLPDLDGTEVIRQLRESSAVPVLVLSGRTGSGDKIGALDAGADDYVTKPFSMEELMARLRALLRRDSHQGSRQVFGIGHCTVDLAAGAENSTHYLRFHVAGLRRKLEDDPPRPRHLLTEPGMGYRYQQ